MPSRSPEIQKKYILKTKVFGHRKVAYKSSIVNVELFKYHPPHD